MLSPGTTGQSQSWSKSQVFLCTITLTSNYLLHHTIISVLLSCDMTTGEKWGIQCNERWPAHKFRGTYLTSSGVNEDPSPDCFLGQQLEKIRGLPTLISTDGMGGGIHLYMHVYVAMVIHVYGVLMKIILVIFICYWHSPEFDLRYQSLVKFVVRLSYYIW